MARAPLLQLSGLTLGHGGVPLFGGLDLTVQPGDRIALVGRNGSGKSTLMKVMAGLVEADAGSRALAPGTTVGYMEQAPDFSGHATLGDFAAAGLDPAEAWRVGMAAEGLKFDPAQPVATASGGEARRAALARLLAAEPGLMLLDEPTNHLDIEAIGWLEARLSETRAAFVIISHDRAFLTALSRATLWLDRGVARRLDRGFDAFEDWREQVWAEEDAARHKLDRRIRAEARWAVEGISARRRRNQGRLRALQQLRTERAAQIRRSGTAAMAFDAAPASGRMVIEARAIAKSHGGRVLLRDFSLRVQRGDRVALVGPNGAGKTTLLRLLTGEEAPDSGAVRLGSGVHMAVFDQGRAQLDPEATLWDSLTAAPGMGVSGRADQVMVRGRPRHVVGYLKDFLFDEGQARAPVRSLSGGERARLLLARIMAQPSNLLVLDEPTNDLDVETLDLLQDLLGGYEGTVLLVSHDRDFIDRAATVTIALDGRGGAVAYAGGHSDMLAQRGAVAGRSDSDQGAGAGAGRRPRPAPVPETVGGGTPPAAARPERAGLSLSERHRLARLPDEIARLEQEIARLNAALADPGLFDRAPATFHKATAALAVRQAALTEAEDAWLALAARAEEAGG